MPNSLIIGIVEIILFVIGALLQLQYSSWHPHWLYAKTCLKLYTSSKQIANIGKKFNLDFAVEVLKHYF